MLVRMDAATFASESSQVGSAARKVQQATSSLASSLNGCAGMAGIDPMAEEFANGTPEQGGYDASMTAMLKGGTTLAQAVASFEAHVLGLAAAYRAMELAGAEPASNRYAGMTATTISGSAPHAGSALGDEGLGTPCGEIMEWIENFLKDAAGIVIPTADTGKVTTAASAWSAFSSDLTAASSSLSASLPATLASEFPQSGAVSAARDKLVEMLDGLSTDAGAISAGCTDYANNVEAIRGELRAMLGQLALEVAIDIGVGVALSFFSFGAGALAGIAKAATTVARWIPKLLSVINRLKALIQTSKRLMALMRRAAIEAIESTVSGTVASAGASLAFGNFSWSGLGGAALSSGIGGVVSGPFSHIGSTMTSRGPRLLVTGGVGAVTGAGGGVAGEWAASQVSGQEFNLLVSALVGAGGGTAGGSLGNIKTPASSSTPSVDVSAPNTTPATASVGGGGGAAGSSASTSTSSTTGSSSTGAPTPGVGGAGGAAAGAGGAAGGAGAPSSTAPTGTGGSAGGSASTSTANPASVPDGHVDPPTHLDIDQPTMTDPQSSGGNGTPGGDSTPGADSTPDAGDTSTGSAGSQPSNTDTTSTDIPTSPGDTDAPSTSDIDRPLEEKVGDTTGSLEGSATAEAEGTPPADGDLDGGSPDVDPSSAAPAADHPFAVETDGAPGRLGTPDPGGWTPRPVAEIIGDQPVLRDGSHLRPDGSMQPNVWYKAGEHEYYYHTDEHGYIDRWVTDDLQLKTHEGRLPHDPNTPGKLPGDHAGHLAADMFGGSPNLDNLVSQLSDVNLSKYRKLENVWAGALKADPPVRVTVDVRITTDPLTGRPRSFKIESRVGDERYDRLLKN